MKIFYQIISIDDKYYAQVFEQSWVVIFKKTEVCNNDYGELSLEIFAFLQKNGLEIHTGDICNFLTSSHKVKDTFKDSLTVIYEDDAIIGSGLDVFVNKKQVEIRENEEIIAKIAQSKPNPINIRKQSYYWMVAMSILLVGISSFFYVKNILENRKPDKESAYIADVDELNAIKARFDGAISDDNTYSIYISEDKIEYISQQIRTLREQINSNYYETAKTLPYVPIDFNEIKNLINDLIEDAKQKEGLAEATRKKKNQCLYETDAERLHHLMDYVNKTIQGVPKDCSTSIIEELFELRNSIDSLKHVIDEQFKSVKDKGEYLSIGTISSKLLEKIDELNDKAYHESEINRKKHKPIANNGLQKVQKPSSDSQTKPNSKETDFYNFKNAGDEAYMRYYNGGGLEQDRLAAIFNYESALRIQNDKGISKKLEQLRK